MKLVRFDCEGTARIGAIKGSNVVDLVASGSRWTQIREIAGAGHGALRELETLVDRATPTYSLTEVRLLAPIERPGKYLAIGMNYAKHLEEADKLGVARSK